jgi:hypothetical protein
MQPPPTSAGWPKPASSGCRRRGVAPPIPTNFSFAERHRGRPRCRHCPVVAECLAYALGNQMEFGVWGGMTERQRRVLLKQHPEVAKFFAAQRWQTGVDQRTGRLIVRQGRPSGAAAKRAEAMANSVDANERRRERAPHVIDWDKAIANLLDILDDIYERRG